MWYIVCMWLSSHHSAAGLNQCAIMQFLITFLGFPTAGLSNYYSILYISVFLLYNIIPNECIHFNIIARESCININIALYCMHLCMIGVGVCMVQMCVSLTKVFRYYFITHSRTIYYIYKFSVQFRVDSRKDFLWR